MNRLVGDHRNLIKWPLSIPLESARLNVCVTAPGTGREVTGAILTSVKRFQHSSRCLLCPMDHFSVAPFSIPKTVHGRTRNNSV